MGSGRPSGRRKVGSVTWLDINKLNRDGALRSGAIYTWRWSLNGQPFGSVTTRGGCNKVTIVFRNRTGDGPWEDVEQSVPIVWKPCRYGGQRPCFVCTGQTGGTCCNRPAAKLYGAGKYFFCRRCYRLAYASQSESYHDRATRRARVIRYKLCGVDDLTEPLPARPKGMWRKTYARLEAKADQADAICNESMMLAYHRILKTSRRLGSRKKGFWL
jgi:hypothetical protein